MTYDLHVAGLVERNAVPARGRVALDGTGLSLRKCNYSVSPARQDKCRHRETIKVACRGRENSLDAAAPD